ncbi:Abi family protein [Nocardioides hankookensis]|uniref:Abi-like protein n=1 Tax=Nocardioides hankookensis TaxID=443157 RepID=A0ABW1LN10_9ACTN
MTSTNQTPSSGEARTATIIARLSEPRLGPYLAAAGGNHKDALRLYGWNIDLSGAVYEALHVFEVVLRNALDQQLCTWNATQSDATTGLPHARDWLMDPSRLLKRLLRDDLEKATKRATTALRGSGRAPGHPDVLTQLTFGTWRFLLPDRDPGRRLLWDQALRHGFPHLSVQPRDLVAQVDGVYRLRNRVAHLEPLLAQGAVRAEYNAMRHVLAAIDPTIEQWFTSRQRITAALRARPV